MPDKICILPLLFYIIMKRILLLLTFPLHGILFCSPFPAAGQPEINRTDAGGLKQGAWEKDTPTVN